ncbi:MAG: replication initiator, partial [Pseudonocardiaceae bacterium]
TSWEEALQEVTEPAHVVSFGHQAHSKGILGGTDDAGRHLGYLTKYLVKSVSEIVTPHTEAQHRHADRLHAELSITPCSPWCAVWLLYGIQPQGTTSRTQPGHCKSRAHRRSTLGLPGRRVLVSRKWSGKTLADHRADRMAFVTQALAAVGITKPAQDTSRLIWRKLAPGDPHVPPRTHLILQAIAQRIAWRAEYDRALLAATRPPPTGLTVSAIPDVA